VRALLYDVHANLPALRAVLADARAAGADRFVLGGDYAFAGARPVETVAILDELDAERVRGNGERWTNAPEQAPDDEFVQRALSWCRRELEEETVARLAGLPEHVELDGALFCHGSPRSDVQTFLPAPTPADAELLAGAGAEVIVFGHSHLQFTRETGGRLFVNPGSVGMPLDGDRRSAYALWHGGREFELRRLEYDADAYVADVHERMGPALGDALGILVRRLEQATFET
jgi:predicted phosphodiesterase